MAQEPPNALRAGTLIADRYRLGVPLESRTSPEPSVWLAQDERRQCRVNLVIRDGGDVVLERLRALHAQLALVEHPVIVAATDVGRAGEGLIYMASPLDGALAASSVDAVDLQTALSWSLEILHGIDAAHLQGLVHGDIGCHSVELLPGRDGHLHARLVGFVVGVVREPDASGPTPGVSADVRGVAEFLFKLLTGSNVGEESAVFRPRPGIDVPPELVDVLIDQLDDPEHNPSALEFASKLGRFSHAPQVAATFDGWQHQRRGVLHDAFESLELARSSEEVFPLLAVQLVTLGELQGAEVLEWAERKDETVSPGRWALVAHAGVCAGRGIDGAGALEQEIETLLGGDTRRFRRLQLAGHAALPLTLSGRRMMIRVCRGVTPDPTDGVESAGATLDAQELHDAALLTAHAAEVWKRVTLVEAFEAEADYRHALLGMTRDALMLVGSQGHVRGLTAGAEALLEVTSEGVVGSLARDTPVLANVADLLARQSLTHQRQVLLESGRSTAVDVHRCLEGAVVRWTPSDDADERAAGVSEDPFAPVIGHDAATQAARRAGQNAALDDAPVYMVGEVGTGRRTLARAIHDASRRRGGPLSIVDGARLPGGAAAAIFGVEPGTAEAAKYGRNTPGKLQLTDGGTLVIVNVESLPDAILERLGAFTATGVYQRQGSQTSARADVRLMFAQTGALEEANEACGALLSELGESFHLIELTPLRERVDALRTLLPSLMERRANIAGRPALLVSPKVFDDLVRHRWPQNVRELVELLDAWLSLLPPETSMITTTPAHIRRELQV